MKQVFAEASWDMEKRFYQELDLKVGAVTASCTKLMKKVGPLQELVQLVQVGKTLPQALSEWVVEDGGVGARI